MGELVEIVANTPKFNFIQVAKNRHEIYTGPFFFGPFDIDYMAKLEAFFSSDYL